MATDIHVTLPIVNMNGSTKQELMEQVWAQYTVVMAAYEVVIQFPPHGRDFQISPAGDYEKAREEHQERSLRLLKTAQELEALYIGLREQGKQ